MCVAATRRPNTNAFPICQALFQKKWFWPGFDAAGSGASAFSLGTAIKDHHLPAGKESRVTDPIENDLEKKPRRWVDFDATGKTFTIAGRTFNLPRTRLKRIALGMAFVTGGFMWFLPVLGLWMLPLGLLILSIDFAVVRKLRRRFTVWNERRKNRAKSGLPTEEK
jgi:hypothetical protein